MPNRNIRKCVVPNGFGYFVPGVPERHTCVVALHRRIQRQQLRLPVGVRHIFGTVL